MSTRPVEIANHHKPPPTCIGSGLRIPNPSPTLSPQKVGPKHRRPVTSHRRPCRCLPGCMSRPRRSEKPTTAFSTLRLTARRRRPPHPAVRRRPQHRRKSRAGRRPPPQGTTTQETSVARRRPTAVEPPHGKLRRQPSRCHAADRAAKDHLELAAPLPHHPGAAVATTGPTPIRPPHEASPPSNPKSGHGTVGSGRSTTRRHGWRPSPTSCSDGPRRPRPPRTTCAKKMKAPPPPSLRARGIPATRSGGGAAGI
jgi:hypothetical protein